MTIDNVLRDHQETAAPGGGLNDQGGCAVDWSWLQGKQIASVTNSLDEVIITFADGTTFTVRALLWEGKPFIAFAPTKDE